MFTVVHVIPTGVGAAIGGFAGDATPVAHLLASVCDRLVTHPNALNAAHFFAKPANALYVEGKALDDWLGSDAHRRAHQYAVVVLCALVPWWYRATRMEGWCPDEAEHNFIACYSRTLSASH